MSQQSEQAMPPARVLALCYMLPPALYPQAIQIGRLLAHSRHRMFRVSGPPGQTPAASGGPDIVVPDDPPRFPALHRLAVRTVPRYASVPDAQRSWATRAEAAVTASQALTAFGPQIIASFGEPMSDHLLGRALARRLSLPWLAHFSDPWADNPFRHRHKLSAGANRALERGVVEDADLLVFTSEETRRLLARTYGDLLLAKSHVLPHSFEPALYPPPRRRAPDGKIVVRYLGNFYGQRTPLPLLRALAILRQRSSSALEKLRFELIGGTPGWMRMLPLARSADPELVRFLPPVSYSASLAQMVEADVLLVIDAPATESVFLPSKLIDYLGALKPVFGIVPPGTSARVITGLGGLTADPADPARVATALETLVVRFEAGAQAPTPAARAAVAAYEATRVGAAFDALVDETLLAAGRRVTA